jgi:hypothetical protein
MSWKVVLALSVLSKENKKTPGCDPLQTVNKRARVQMSHKSSQISLLQSPLSNDDFCCTALTCGIQTEENEKKKNVPSVGRFWVNRRSVCTGDVVLPFLLETADCFSHDCTTLLSDQDKRASLVPLPTSVDSERVERNPLHV